MKNTLLLDAAVCERFIVFQLHLIIISQFFPSSVSKDAEDDAECQASTNEQWPSMYGFSVKEISD